MTDISSQHPHAESVLWRFRREIKKLLKLGIPLMIGHMAVIGMAVTDTIMAGRVSANDLAGLAIGAGLWSALSVMIMGLLGSVSPVVAQLFGAQRHAEIGPQVRQGLWIALAIGLIVSGMLSVAPSLLALMGLTPEIEQISGNYLQALVWGSPALALSSLLRSFCEAVGRTRPSMMINLAAFLLNILLDYLLVFGHLGFPEMGSVGCAWATSAIYWLMLAAFIFHSRTASVYAPFALFQRLERPHWPHIRHLLHLGLPISIGVTGEVLFFGIIALMLAPLGAEVVGSHQIAQNIGALVFMLPVGQCQAAGIRVAHNIGAGRPDFSRFSAWSSMGLGAMIACVTALITVLGRDTLVSFYSEDLGVQQLATHLLLFCAAYQVMDALQVIAWGALRGYKDTKFPMVLQLTAYWALGFPLGYSLALTDTWGAPLGAVGFWIGLCGGLVAATLFLGVRLHILSRRFCVSAEPSAQALTS